VFHIGFVVVFLGLGAHITFIKGLTGLSSPNLPTNLIVVVGVITLASLVAALVRRLINPVQRLISTFDDYSTWLVTVLPLVTGLAAAAHFGEHYENTLAVHILSVELFLIWLPFSKLMHMVLFVFSRGMDRGTHDTSRCEGLRRVYV